MWTWRAEQNICPDPCPAGAFSNLTDAENTGSYSNTSTPCPAGTYSAAIQVVSAATCTPCPAGTSSEQVGASSSSTCTACASGTTSAAGSRECPACSTGSCAVGEFRGACAAATDAPCWPCSAPPEHAVHTGAGQPFDADDCAWECESDFFKTNSTCAACPWKTSSAEGKP